MDVATARRRHVHARASSGTGSDARRSCQHRETLVPAPCCILLHLPVGACGVAQASPGRLAAGLVAGGPGFLRQVTRQRAPAVMPAFPLCLLVPSFHCLKLEGWLRGQLYRQPQVQSLQLLRIAHTIPSFVSEG